MGRSLERAESVISCCVEVLPWRGKLPCYSLRTCYLIDDADASDRARGVNSSWRFATSYGWFFSNACALQVGMHCMLIQPDQPQRIHYFPTVCFVCVDGSFRCNFESVVD